MWILWILESLIESHIDDEVPNTLRLNWPHEGPTMTYFMREMILEMMNSQNRVPKSDPNRSFIMDFGGVFEKLLSTSL